MTKTNIIFIGMPGSGKTSAAAALSRLCPRYVIADTDSMVEKECLMSIPHIFEQYGEYYFRQKESEAINRAASQTYAAISTGGGAVISKKNADILRVSGHIVYLRCGARKVHERLPQGGSRPLLLAANDNERLSFIQCLLREREHGYLYACDCVIDAELFDAEQCAARALIYAGIKV